MAYQADRRAYAGTLGCGFLRGHQRANWLQHKNLVFMLRLGRPRSEEAPTPPGASSRVILLGVDEPTLARELADIADEISLGYFHHPRDKATRTKQDGTLVTAADEEIEAALRRRIWEEFPGHAVLGEEEGLVGDPTAPVWIIDPIDGTNNFAWGVPIFATLIAHVVDGVTTIGVASAPALGERYEGIRGDGALMNGKPIHVSDVATIEGSRILYSSLKGLAASGLAEVWVKLLARCRRERGFGDFWGHMLVARGAADIMAEPSLSIWDVAALEVIVHEAGGRATGFDGVPYPGLEAYKAPSSLLTTNGLLHDEVVGTLATASSE